MSISVSRFMKDVWDLFFITFNQNEFVNAYLNHCCGAFVMERCGDAVLTAVLKFILLSGHVMIRLVYSDKKCIQDMYLYQFVMSVILVILSLKRNIVTNHASKWIQGTRNVLCSTILPVYVILNHNGNMNIVLIDMLLLNCVIAYYKNVFYIHKSVCFFSTSVLINQPMVIMLSVF